MDLNYLGRYKRQLMPPVHATHQKAKFKSGVHWNLVGATLFEWDNEFVTAGWRMASGQIIIEMRRASGEMLQELCVPLSQMTFKQPPSGQENNTWYENKVIIQDCYNNMCILQINDKSFLVYAEGSGTQIEQINRQGEGYIDDLKALLEKTQDLQAGAELQREIELSNRALKARMRFIRKPGSGGAGASKVAEDISILILARVPIFRRWWPWNTGKVFEGTPATGYGEDAARLRAWKDIIVKYTAKRFTHHPVVPLIVENAFYSLLDIRGNLIVQGYHINSETTVRVSSYTLLLKECRLVELYEWRQSNHLVPWLEHPVGFRGLFKQCVDPTGSLSRRQDEGISFDLCPLDTSAQFVITTHLSERRASRVTTTVTVHDLYHNKSKQRVFYRPHASMDVVMPTSLRCVKRQRDEQCRIVACRYEGKFLYIAFVDAVRKGVWMYRSVWEEDLPAESMGNAVQICAEEPIYQGDETGSICIDKTMVYLETLGQDASEKSVRKILAIKWRWHFESMNTVVTFKRNLEFVESLLHAGEAAGRREGVRGVNVLNGLPRVFKDFVYSTVNQNFNALKTLTRKDVLQSLGNETLRLIVSSLGTEGSDVLARLNVHLPPGDNVPSTDVSSTDVSSTGKKRKTGFANLLLAQEKTGLTKDMIRLRF